MNTNYFDVRSLREAVQLVLESMRELTPIARQLDPGELAASGAWYWGFGPIFRLLRGTIGFLLTIYMGFVI